MNPFITLTTQDLRTKANFLIALLQKGGAIFSRLTTQQCYHVGNTVTEYFLT